MTEVELFKKGIKPAILLRVGELVEGGISDECGNIPNHLYHREFRGGIIVSHKPIPQIDNNNLPKIGKMLGYFPEACNHILDDHLPNISISFGGIRFNTKGKVEQSLTWCRREYLEKMLRGRITVKYLITSYYSEMPTTLRVGTITYRKGGNRGQTYGKIK